MSGIEAEIDFHLVGAAANQQSRSCEQHNGNRHLQGNESAAKNRSATGGGGAGARSELLRGFNDCALKRRHYTEQ